MRRFTWLPCAGLGVGALLTSTSQAQPFRTCNPPQCIQTESTSDKPPAFDLTRTAVDAQRDELTFHHRVHGQAGSVKPSAKGQLGGAGVYSYVWPTDLDSSRAGFESQQGILALAVTAHPDFDDTPNFDENGDGRKDNDGAEWHSHWVVLTPDDNCGPAALKVKDIPAGDTPKLPENWPNLPILIDSPGYKPVFNGHEIDVRVPRRRLGETTGFSFDGVTADLVVNENTQAPLLCVTKVHDVASSNLSLPGRIVTP